MRALTRFTAIMGPLSSLFDLATFALLLWVFRVDVATFRAAWFVESMASQILVVFVIRTLRPSWRSRPDMVLVMSTLGGLALALLLPFGPWAAPLGFAPLSGGMLAVLAGLVLVYLAVAELLKRVTLSVPRDAGKGA